MSILVEGRPRQHRLAAIDLRAELHLGTVVSRQRRQADRDGLFAGSDAGGERAVIAYTILACCRFAYVKPVEYLRAKR
jgi:hypothetical protein